MPGYWFDVSFDVLYVDGRIDDGEIGIYAASRQEAKEMAREQLEAQIARQPCIRSIYNIVAYGR